MARTTHTAKAYLGSYPTLPPTALSADQAYVACNATDKEQVALTGKEILCFFNSGATGRVITISSVADGSRRRTGDIVYTLGAGLYCEFGPMELEGFRQTDGMLYFEAAHAEVLVRVRKLP